jgi:hypothetical protein
LFRSVCVPKSLQEDQPRAAVQSENLLTARVLEVEIALKGAKISHIHLAEILQGRPIEQPVMGNLAGL